MSAQHTDAMQIARRYATAMFSIAKEQGKESSLVNDINVLSAAILSSAELQSALLNPLVTRAQKSAVLEALCASMSAASLTRDALAVLARGGRASLLPEVAKLLRAMLSADRGEVVAEVTSARPLNAAVKKQLEAALAAATGKQVELNLHEDPALLGGLMVQLGSVRLDASLAGALGQMRRQLLTTGNA